MHNLQNDQTYTRISKREFLSYDSEGLKRGESRSFGVEVTRFAFPLTLKFGTGKLDDVAAESVSSS